MIKTVCSYRNEDKLKSHPCTSNRNTTEQMSGSFWSFSLNVFVILCDQNGLETDKVMHLITKYQIIVIIVARVMCTCFMFPRLNWFSFKCSTRSKVHK